MVLKLKAIEGMRSEEVAKISGLCHTSVNKIVSRYKAEGIEAIFGKQVLEFLEREAAALDYTRIILETGTVNEKAVRFYLSNGYRVCENYGKYVGRADSVCFSKDL